MKKYLSAVLALVLMLGFTPVYADDEEPATGGETEFTLYEPYDPQYTITIPATVQLSATEHTLVPVTASDVKYLPENTEISVTLVRGSGIRGRLYMSGTDEETGKEYLMTLMIKGTDGEFKMGALENQIIGMELASFTADGEQTFEVYPCAQDYPNATADNLIIHKGVHYSGSMTYGIELKAAD